MKGEEYLPLGYITSPHGIKGHVLLKTYSGEGTSLLRGLFLYLNTSVKDNVALKIKDSKPYKNAFIVKFEGIDDRNSSEELVGAEVFIKRSDLPEPDENEYYWIDLIGCDVYTVDGEFIGKVDYLIGTGAVDVIVVKKDKKEFLYPLSENVVKHIDIVSKKIVVDLSIFQENT